MANPTNFIKPTPSAGNYDLEAATSTDHRLLENGDDRLLENGTDFRLLESGKINRSINFAKITPSTVNYAIPAGS